MIPNITNQHTFSFQQAWRLHSSCSVLC